MVVLEQVEGHLVGEEDFNMANGDFLDLVRQESFLRSGGRRRGPSEGDIALGVSKGLQTVAAPLVQKFAQRQPKEETFGEFVKRSKVDPVKSFRITPEQARFTEALPKSEGLAFAKFFRESKEKPERLDEFDRKITITPTQSRLSGIPEGTETNLGTFKLATQMRKESIKTRVGREGIRARAEQQKAELEFKREQLGSKKKVDRTLNKIKALTGAAKVLKGNELDQVTEALSELVEQTSGIELEPSIVDKMQDVASSIIKKVNPANLFNVLSTGLGGGLVQPTPQGQQAFQPDQPLQQQAPQFNSDEEVRAAFERGEIDANTAAQILRTQFGFE